MLQRYLGRVSSLKQGEKYGFIGLATITMEDGSMHDLTTTKDVFIHEDDADAPLHSGMSVNFEVEPDEARGGNALRAKDVIRHAQNLVLVGADASESRAVTDPRQLYVAPTQAQKFRMKPVPADEVEKVLSNKPMPRIPRNFDSSESAQVVAHRLMHHLFPQFAALDSRADMADSKFDDVIAAAIKDHKALKMEAQADHMRRMADTYKGLRTIITSEEDLLRPDTLIPIQYLPDLFMAVPVWYFFETNEVRARSSDSQGNPIYNAVHKHFFGLMPNERWGDTFLMFNHRTRTLADYQGDIIPPKVIARMKKLAPLFDYLVIMTPYHDAVAKEWGALQWARNVDPYVVGFLKGIPLMFMVGRFSDSGVFPLHTELVADTIQFLRRNAEKLLAYNRKEIWNWHPAVSKAHREDYTAIYGDHSSVCGLGTKLQARARELLAAFDREELFDWLRGDQPTPKPA
jgi:hypothetical protein